MPASLLSPDSSALERGQDLLAHIPALTQRPGLPQARMLVDYVLGRRSGELDVSGRPTEGTFVAAEAVAEVPYGIVVVDDAHGLQARLLAELAHVATYNDRLDEARAAAEFAGHLPALERLSDLGLVGGPKGAADQEEPGETWAFVNAPKASNALAETIAALQPHVTTLAVVGRSDSMSRAVNKELSRGFARVDVSPGVGKHRLIIGSRPLSSPSLPSFPKRSVISHPAVGPLEVRAHGACFSGVKSDEGSSLLLESIAADPGSPGSVLDLGCGNGWLLSAVMKLTGADTGTGVDVSKAAVASTRETASANGIDVTIALTDATDDSAANATDVSAAAGTEHLGEFELIVLNPPFHQGTTIETDTAQALMRTASTHLAPGGRVVTVFNSHLRYRDRLETIIGPSEQVGRNKKFTVIASRPR